MSVYPSLCPSVRILSGQHLLNRSTFCNQTWYGGVLSRDGVSYRKISLQSSRSRSQWGLIQSEYYCFYYTSSELLTLLQSTLVWWYILICRSVMWKKEKRLLCSRSRSQWNFITSINVCSENSFWTTELFNLDVVMYHHEPEWKDWFAVFNVKVTVKASFGQIMIFYSLPDCWSCCNQTWFDGIIWIVV